MTNYLDQVGSTYYFRRGIPKELRPFILSESGKPRADFKIALGTKDRSAAKQRIPFYTMETDKLFNRARAMLAANLPKPTPRQTAALKRDSDAFEAAADDYEDKADYWEKSLTNGAYALSFEQPLFDMLQSARDERDKLASLLKVQKSPPPSASIMGLFERYAAQPGIRPETVKQFRSILRHFTGHIGHDDAARITAANVIGWRNFLQTEIGPRDKVRSVKTINASYMAAVNATFAYALDQQAIPHNPVAGVAKVRSPRKVQLRGRDFTRYEQATILAAATLPPDGRHSPEFQLARRWVPWLCAYTGARVNEITQLRAQDIKQIDGVWCITITPEAGSVKTDQARTIPLHPHLIEQGFTALCGNQAIGPLFYNPGNARGGSARGQYKRTGMRLAEWVRSLGITGVQPNHGWRHTFKTICQEAGIDERAADYIQGHASKGVGRSYGSNSLPALAKQVALFPLYPWPFPEIVA